MKGRQHRVRKQNGVVAIEFSLGIFVYLMMIFFWIEVSYMGFVTAMVDYAVAESSRTARSNLQNRDYQAVFKQYIKHSNSGWSDFIDAESFELKTVYFQSISSLYGCTDDPDADECKGEPSPKNNPIAIYRVTYPYKPLFASVLGLSLQNMIIAREVISIQEYERNGGSS